MRSYVLPIVARLLHACTTTALLLALPAVGQAPGPVVTRDIPYFADTTGSYAADLYQPTSSGTHPAVVAIHGGSWRSGRKSELRRLCTDLAVHGYVCFSIDYDLHPHSFPYSWQESRAAVDFVRQHAADYNVDPHRIAVLGTSAGGQLAALLAVAPQGPRATASFAPVTPPTDVPVEAAVLFNGGYDVHPKAYLLRRYLGGTCKDLPAICTDASPDDHIRPGLPPIYVGHGNHDHLIPYSQATTFIALLRAAHDPVTPFIATGAGHSYWKKRHWYGRNLQAAEQFLQNALATPPELSNTPPESTSAQ